VKVRYISYSNELESRILTSDDASEKGLKQYSSCFFKQRLSQHISNRQARLLPPKVQFKLKSANSCTFHFEEACWVSETECNDY
jgi:hypothetical protein